MLEKKYLLATPGLKLHRFNTFPGYEINSWNSVNEMTLKVPVIVLAL